MGSNESVQWFIQQKIYAKLTSTRQKLLGVGKSQYFDQILTYLLACYFMISSNRP